MFVLNVNFTALSYLDIMTEPSVIVISELHLLIKLPSNQHLMIC